MLFRMERGDWNMANSCCPEALNERMVCDETVGRLRQHLIRQYSGIFDDQVIEQHIAEYVNTESAEDLARFLVEEDHVGKNLLDIGAGYGTNVLAARQAGINAMGLELAEFEVEFARDRLRNVRPADTPEAVYLQGDAMALPLTDASMDVVTIMNVLEHVPDYRRVLSEASRVLKPGGKLYVVCPNYAAFRKEAHYHVPWFPLMPRWLASRYLKAMGRNSGFFENCIFYCTNWGVLWSLRGLSFKLASLELVKIDHPYLIRSQKTKKILAALRSLHLLWLLKIIVALGFFSPLKQSVSLAAQKARGQT
jgi:MPBQ/MSBQ methyltransferase